MHIKNTFNAGKHFLNGSYNFLNGVRIRPTGFQEKYDKKDYFRLFQNTFRTPWELQVILHQSRLNLTVMKEKVCNRLEEWFNRFVPTM